MKLLLIGIFLVTSIIGPFIHLDPRYSSSELGDSAVISKAPGLQDGVDTYSLTLTTGGSASWFYNDTESFCDGDSIQSGDIGHNQITYVTATVNGPGTLEFYWQVSCELAWDTLKFYINGIQKATITGTVSWQHKTFSVNDGLHTFRWEYSKDGSYSAGLDCGWLDCVSWNLSPTLLSEDSTIQDHYKYTSTRYYYKTGTALNAYYHVVWLQPVESYNDFDLYLYSDSNYSTEAAFSTEASGDLDWVVFRPSISQPYNPLAYIQAGTGYAYIEWKISYDRIFVDSSNSAFLNASECIEIYQISLSSSSTYDFTLDVPSSGDYDFYFFYLSPGSATNSTGYVGASASSGLGVDEAILAYSPPVSGDYVILVARRSGAGPYYLASQLSSSSTSPGFDSGMLLLIVGIVLITLSGLLLLLEIKHLVQRS